MKHSIEYILVNAFPGRQWKIIDNDYSTLEFFDDGPIITMDQIIEADVTLPDLSYQADRYHAYEQVQDWLDKLWHDIDNGTLDKSGKFYTSRLTIKQQFPKPQP